MTSILIHGGDQQKREEAAAKLIARKGGKEEINLINLGEGEEKLGIEQIKRVLLHLHITKSGKQRVFVIPESQRLTIAAQNAILKLLEEPPGELVIILTVPNPKLLLPTVVSRCLIIETQKEKQDIRKAIVEEFLDSASGRRLMLFEEKIGYRQKAALTFFDEVETYLRSEEGLDSKSAQLLIKLWQTKKLLRSESANTKLVIDELLLSW